MKRTTRAFTNLAVLSIAALTLGGCSSSPTQPKTTAAAVNPVKPDANARIQLQTFLGNPAKWTSLFEMTGSNGSNRHFRGWYDGFSSVGLLGATGNIQWSARLPYTVRQVLTLPPLTSVPGGMLGVGKHDLDGDGSSDVGYAWLFSATGSMVGSALYSSDTSDVWVNAAAAVSDTEFILVGGERTPARSNPFIARIDLSHDGQLVKRSHVVLTGMSDRLFARVGLDPAGPVGGKLSLFVLDESDVAAATTLRVDRISVDYPALTSPTLVWTRDVAAAGPTCVAGQLSVFEDHVYVSGHTDDSGKPAITGGGQWQSGMAARLTLDGTVEWSKFLRHGDYSDVCDIIAPASDATYLVGIAERYMLSKSKDLFGYGWIEKLAPASGDQLASFTIGSDAYESGFNTAHYEGGALFTGGWTNGEVNGGTYRGWYCGIDVSGTTTPLKSSPASSSTPGERIADRRARGDNAR